MKYLDFMPSADAVKVLVTCAKCGKDFETEEFRVPYPNYAADNHSDSEREEGYMDICPHCGKEYSFDVINGYGGGTIIIPELEENANAECHEICYEDYIQDEIDEYSTVAPQFAYFSFEQSLSDIRKAISELHLLSPEVQQVYVRLLYANAIGSMEAFLSSSLKQIIFTSPKYKRLFVETFKDFSNESLPLNKIFERMAELDTKIVKSLNELMYHNLAKIKGIYKSTLGVDFGDIKSICQKVEIRHHIVHRNGNDKDGNPVNIKLDDLTALVDEVEAFVNSIKVQIDGIDYKE